MTRLGVPTAVIGWIPEPVREFFLAATATLARVLEVGRCEEVVVLVPDGSWPDVKAERLAQDWDFFSFRLLEAELAVACPSGELPFPPSPPSDWSFLEPFLFAETATIRFHGNTLMMEGRLRDLAAAAASLAFLLFWTAV